LRYAAPARTTAAVEGAARGAPGHAATLTRPALRILARRLERAIAELPDA
jgi:hypothetical protein